MALPAAVIAEYANGKGLGWKFVDAMYDHDIEELQTQEQVMKVAESVGINLADAQKHMNPDDPVWKRVQRDVHTADAIKVTETPTFVIIARGVPPTAALGNELFTTIKQPQYQELINGK
jgi:predicted DsbA family dithiol-disulfide isomerase